jgi:hypothetical protein
VPETESGRVGGNFFVGSISIFYWKGASHINIKRRSSNWRSLISITVSGIYSALLDADAIIMVAVTP